jgi:hypothetical protein
VIAEVVLPTSDMVDGPIANQTAGGTSLTVTIENIEGTEVYQIDNATISTPDVLAKNGILHGISAVLAVPGTEYPPKPQSSPVTAPVETPASKTSTAPVSNAPTPNPNSRSPTTRAPTLSPNSAISEQCVNSTLTLSKNEALSAAAPSGSCNIDVTQSDSCAFDFSNISADFESLCTNLGGKFYEENIEWDCEVSVSGQFYNVTYNYLNYPSCLGGSCTVAEAMEFYDTNVLPAFQQGLANQGLNCDLTSESNPIGSPKSIPTNAPQAPTNGPGLAPTIANNRTEAQITPTSGSNNNTVTTIGAVIGGVVGGMIIMAMGCSVYVRRKTSEDAQKKPVDLPPSHNHVVPSVLASPVMGSQRTPDISPTMRNVPYAAVVPTPDNEEENHPVSYKDQCRSASTPAAAPTTPDTAEVDHGVSYKDQCRNSDPPAPPPRRAGPPMVRVSEPGLEDRSNDRIPFAVAVAVAATPSNSLGPRDP